MAQSKIAAKMKSEIVKAMKAKDKVRLGVLRMMHSAVKQVEIDTRNDLSDSEVLKILTSYGRKVKDQIKSYGEAEREELRSAAVAELAIVGEFLPAEMTDNDLRAIVVAAVAETGASGPQDMGNVMKAVMPKTAGRADGSRVSAMVKEILVG